MLQIKHCHTPSTDVRWVDRCYRRTIHQPTSLVRQSPATERRRMVLFCSISRKNELKMHPVEGVRLALPLIRPSPTPYVIPVIHVTNTLLCTHEPLYNQNYGTKRSHENSMETSDKGCNLTRYLMTLFAAIAILKFNQEATMDTKENTTEDHSQRPRSYTCIAYRSCVRLIAKSCIKMYGGEQTSYYCKVWIARKKVESEYRQIIFIDSNRTSKNWNIIDSSDCFKKVLLCRSKCSQFCNVCLIFCSFFMHGPEHDIGWLR